jgi:YVTN family beta-propeller protein
LFLRDKIHLLLPAILALTLGACDGLDALEDAASATDACVPAEARCEGEGIQICGDDKRWAEVEACPTGEACMVMPNGVTHCMATAQQGAKAVLYFSADKDAGAWWITAIDPPSGVLRKQWRAAELDSLTVADATVVPGWGDVVPSADGSRIFAAAPAADRVVVIDVATLEVTATIEVGGRPTTLLNPNQNGEIWVQAADEGAFYIIDAATLDVAGPLSASLDDIGGGRLLASAGLGSRYYATNTSSPAVFPIDGAGRTVGTPIEVCGTPCADDPGTVTDETTLLCGGGASERAFNAGMGWVIVQCNQGAGYSFINAFDNSVVADKRAIKGIPVQTPGGELIFVIGPRLTSGQVQIWDTAAVGHNGLDFDQVVDVAGVPSPRGTQFQQVGEGWQAWIPQTEGDKLVILDVASLAVSEVTIGTLTMPAGELPGQFMRHSAVNKRFFYTYDDAGVVLVSMEDLSVLRGDALHGTPQRVVFSHAGAMVGGHTGSSGGHGSH